VAGRFAPRPTRTTVRGGHVDVPAPASASAPAAVPRQVSGPGAPAPGLTRRWDPPGPLDLGLVLGPLRRGPADPTTENHPVVAPEEDAEPEGERPAKRLFARERPSEPETDPVAAGNEPPDPKQD